MRRNTRKRWSEEGFSLLELIIVVTIIGIIAIITSKKLGYFDVNFSSETFSVYLEKLGPVVKSNFGFWLAIFTSFTFGIWRKFAKPKEFLWIELPIQLIVVWIVIWMLFSFFFATSANLNDVEIWNGQVKRAEYYEKWTEEVCEDVCDSKDDNGNCTSSHEECHNVYHPPEWYSLVRLGTDSAKISINKGTYQNYLALWNNETKKGLFHAGQVSLGDGDMFFSVQKGEDDKVIVPASQQRNYINYVKGSQTIKVKRGNAEKYKQYLRPYPRVHGGRYGDIEFDRILEVGVSLPEEWKKTVDRNLDLALVRLGFQKECNILLYVVNTDNEKVSYGIIDKWNNGKKNDVLIIIGAPNFPKIEFVHVHAWTDIARFPIELQDRLIGLDFNNAEEVSSTIVDQINKAPKDGGFQRKRMQEFEYLISDIRLPIWAQFLIWSISCAVAFGLSFFLEHNKWRKNSWSK